MNIEKVVIRRTGFPPLQFKSVQSWEATSRNHKSTRWTDVRIYRTVGGRYVAEVRSLTLWEGEQDFSKAQSFASAQEVIEWLKDDDGRLGRVSQEAVDRASGMSGSGEADPGFVEVFVEVVE